MTRSSFVTRHNGQTGLVIPAVLACVVDAALERHLDRLYTNGGAIDPDVHQLGLDARRLAAAHALGLIDVPDGEHTFATDHDALIQWIPTAQYASQLGITPRAVRQRITRGTLPARQVAGRWLVEGDPQCQAA